MKNGTPAIFSRKIKYLFIYMDSIYNLNIVGYLVLFIICFINLFSSDYESISLLLLFTFHSFLTVFMLIFRSSIIGTGEKTDIAKYTYYSLFTGNILLITSLLFVVITYSHLHNEYKLKNDENVPLSRFYKEKMKIFKILYITCSSLILSILFLINFSNINILNYVSLFLSISLLGIAGYNVYNSNIILKLNNKRAIK
jgi:hypothetical protein